MLESLTRDPALLRVAIVMVGLALGIVAEFAITWWLDRRDEKRQQEQLARWEARQPRVTVVEKSSVADVIKGGRSTYGALHHRVGK